MSAEDRIEDTVHEVVEEWSRLKRLEDEYLITVKVLAILAERLLAATGGKQIEIADTALRDLPDMVAWRDHERRQVVITAER